jgi:outer membrane protein TolC
VSALFRRATAGLAAWLLPRVAFASPLSADDVVRYTLDHHPDAVAAQASVDIAAADRREASVFLWNPDVEATVGISGASQVQVAQPLSPSGEGYATRRAATLRGEAAALDQQRSKLVLASEARNAWIEAAAASRRADLTDELLALAKDLRAAAEGRAAQGEASDLDVRLARLEEAHALSTALDARHDEAAARTLLASFHPEALAAELGDPLDGAPVAVGGNGERSDLAAARRDADAARAGLSQERAALLDPVALGASLGVGGGGPTTIGPYVAWSVPLWTRNQGGIARATGDVAVTEALTTRLERVVAADQATADTFASSADADFSHLSDADADARAALAAIESGVQSGELDLSTAALLRAEVLDGWTSALDARTTTAEARVARLLAHDDPSLLAGAR